MLFSRRPRTDEFEAAALPHMNDIYRTAARLLGNGTGADDVVQDVYLQAWKSFGQFELGPIAVPGCSRFCFTRCTTTAGNG
jgi:DNA-directed RNA polymerase specialized sigma24 family protein